MMKKIVAAGALLSLFLTNVPWAEGAEKDERMKTLETVVVTATKTRERQKDVPNPVIVKDSLDIEESPAKSLGELLANEPGVDWRTRGNYGGASEEIHMRGMGGNEIQVFVNGISINSPSIGSADVSGVPLNSIERVEVVKGAGSLLYGSGAMAGTVNVITKSPRRERMAFGASAGYGTQDSYEVSAEQGMFVFKDFGYYLTATRKETDGFRENGDLLHHDVSLKLVFDRGDSLDISLYGDYIDRDYGRPGIDPPPAANPQHHYINGVKFYDDTSASLLDEGETRDAHTVLEIKSQPADWLGFGIKGYYTDMQSYDTMRDNSAGWTTPAGAGIKTRVDNKITGAEGNVELQPVDGASLLLGADIKEHDYKTCQKNLDANGVEQPGETTNKAEIETKGFYAEAQYRPFRYGKLLAGIRQENHATFGTENMPLVGLVINPLGGTALKATHGKHFKAPTPNDLYWPEDDFVRGNPDLKPQTGWHTDVTLEQELMSKKLRLAVSYFNWNVEDKIEWAQNPNFPGPFGDKWTPTNVSKSSGSGWEAGIRYDPLHFLGFSLGYTHTNAQDKQPGLIRAAQYVPDHRLKGDAVYRAAFGLTAAATLRYVSSRPYFQGNSRIPIELAAYTTTDLKISQRFRENWLFSVEGLNLLDEEYDTYYATFVDGSGTTHYGPYPGAGRSVFASVTYQY